MPSISFRRLAVGALAVSLVPVASAFAGGTSKVTMDEFSLEASQKSVTAGKETFDARNNGPNRQKLIVIKTPRPPSRQPQSDGRASEKGRVDDSGTYARRKSKKLTLS